MPGRIQQASISMDLHPIQIRPVEFDRAGIQCHLNDLHPIQIGLVKFNRALITQIG